MRNEKPEKRGAAREKDKMHIIVDTDEAKLGKHIFGFHVTVMINYENNQSALSNEKVVVRSTLEYPKAFGSESASA